MIKELIQIKSLFTKKKPDNGAPYVWGTPQNIRVEREQKRAALKNWSGICINRIAENVANTRFYFDKDGKEIETEFDFIFKRANISYVPYELFYLLTKSLEYSGNAFLKFPLFGGNTISQWWWLPTERVKFQINNLGQYSTFSIYSDKGAEEIPVNEICHIKTMDVVSDLSLLSYYVGQPRVLSSVIDDVFSDEDKSEYIQRYFERDGADPFVITSPKPIGLVQSAEFKQKLNSVLPKGYIVAAILDDDKNIQPVTSSGSISQGISEEIRDKICSAYGVPVAFLTGEYQNRATSQVVRETVFTTVIEPRVKLICEYLTNYFRKFGLPDNVKLTYDSGKFYDEELFNRQVEFAVMQGFMQEPEYRELLGLPEAQYDTTTGQVQDQTQQNITENNVGDTVPSNTQGQQQI